METEPDLGPASRPGGRARRAEATLTARLAAIGAAIYCAALALLVLRSGAARPDGEWLPFSNDAFYHAHRILAVASGRPLPQYDPDIQAPFGSFVTWPWAYDWTLGKLTRLGLALAPEAAPMLIAGLIPVAGLALGIAVVLAIARELKLGPAAAGLAALLYAFAPLALGNHMIGSVDHHWAESMAVLAAVWSLLRWQRLGDVPSALLHGVLLAAAQGVQNGMFMLQAFTLLVLFVGWTRAALPPPRSVAAFAAGLIGGTLALVLPSLPFRLGFTEFHFLGWFHWVAACGSGLFALALVRVARSPHGLAVLAMVAAAVTAVIAPQFLAGGRFVAADDAALDAIQETASLFEHLVQNGLLAHLAQFTVLPLLALPLLVAMLKSGWRNEALRAFALFALPCCVLQLLQMRFWSFGLGLSALVVAWWVQRAMERSTEPAATRALGAAFVGLAVLAPTARDLGKDYAPAASDWYRPLAPMIAPLRQACAERPRVLLAEPDYGHLVTYFTGCRVMSNNFIMSPQDYATRARVRRLFDLSPAQLRDAAPEVELVLADVEPAAYRAARGGRPPPLPAAALERALLDPAQPPPEGFRVLAKGSVRSPRGALTTHRLFEVVRNPP